MRRGGGLIDGVVDADADGRGGEPHSRHRGRGRHFEEIQGNVVLVLSKNHSTWCIKCRDFCFEATVEWNAPSRNVVTISPETSLHVEERVSGFSAAED